MAACRGSLSLNGRMVSQEGVWVQGFRVATLLLESGLLSSAQVLLALHMLMCPGFRHFHTKL